MTRIYLLIDPEGHPDDGWEKPDAVGDRAKIYEVLTSSINTSINTSINGHQKSILELHKSTPEVPLWTIEILRSLLQDLESPGTEVLTTLQNTKTKVQKSKSPEIQNDLQNDLQKGRPVTKTPDPSFDVFWSVYPRRESKRGAASSFARALRQTDAERLIEGARRYATDPNRLPEYTKLATTWLNQGCWDDEPLPPRRGENGKRLPFKEYGIDGREIVP